MDDDFDDQPGRPPPEPQTLDEARSILDQIRFDNGIYNDEDEAEIGKTSIHFQRKAKEAARKGRKRLGAAIKAVSTQLYSSRFRFIYEMIQNADDALYSKCLRNKDVPFMTFTVRPGQIVIDSNEDGFTVADVFAICDIAQSSKQNNQATTGEKGLGFKSVFSISRIARIQSGLWSFEFRYPPGDDGLGMIAPYWIEPTSLPDGCGTRITLTMSRTDDDFRQELNRAFEDVPDTTLLFLRKIERLTICFEKDEEVIKTHTFARGSSWDGTTRLISVDLDNVKTSLQYRMRSKIVSVQPKNQADNPNPSAPQSTVVQLAFPLDPAANGPRVSSSGQHTFNFLPMKRMAQLPFIIQADFELAASREAAIDNPRNRQLRDATCETFALAIEDFSKFDASLRYTWTRFLPGHQLDDFWNPIRGNIRDRLSSKHLLYPREVTLFGAQLRLIRDLRVVPSWFEHQDEPLLKCSSFINPAYDEQAIADLKTLGLPVFTRREALDRVKQDLNQIVSTIKSTELSDDWHTTLTEFLLHDICEDVRLRQELRQLAVVPVWSVGYGVIWMTPASQNPPIYLPQSDSDADAPTIDPEIGLLTVHPDACVISARCQFYAFWGIRHVDPKTIISKMLEKNRALDSKTVGHYYKHWATLFWHWGSSAVNATPTWAVDTRCKVLDSRRLYHRSEQDYSMDQLLSGTIDHVSFGFLNAHYLTSDEAKNSVVRHMNGNRQTWDAWLSNVAGVRTNPELQSLGYNGLSPVFQEIISKQPAKVVGTLRAHWNDYKTDVTSSQAVLVALKNALVHCRNGMKYPLSQTILPTDVLLSTSRLFGVEEKMPFLLIEQGSGSINGDDWSFLSVFGVSVKPSLSFNLDALRYLTSLPASGEQTKGNAIAVYERIGSTATFLEKAELQTFFNTQSAVLVGNRWATLGECVWDGPLDFPIGKTVLAQEYKERPGVHNLFTGHLQLGNATYKDVLLAIEARKRAVASPSIMIKMYKALYDMIEASNLASEICNEFETKSLVFDGLNWLPPSACVWSSAVSLRGRPAINKVYPSLSNFFVGWLGLKAMTTPMMLEEVIRLAKSGSADPSEIKTMLRELASMLTNAELTDKVEDLLRKLKQSKFLPLSDPGSAGRTPLVSAKDSFFIVDDRRTGDAFHGKVKLLDFPSNEFTLMQPLFAALRLESTYLSRHVTIETSVEDAVADSKLTEDMRRRSFAISCCVLSHKSSYAQAEYAARHQQLLICEVLTSDAMHTTFNVTQDRHTVTVPSETSLLKISADDGSLKIYVPKDAIQRRRCYRAHLPRQLMDFLDVTAQHCEKQLYRILNDRASTLKDCLFEEGIPEVDSLERPDVPDEVGSENGSEELENMMARWHLAPPSGAITPDGGHVIVEAASASSRRYGGRTGLPGDARPPWCDDDDSGYDTDLPASYSPERYRKVLEHVVRRAQAVGSSAAPSNGYALPTRGDLGMQHGPVKNKGIFKLIGAAGELFVYERLRALGLTTLVRSDWQSTIRHLVNSLPAYHDLPRFTEPEIADIMHDDAAGELEKLVQQFHRCPNWPRGSLFARPIQFMLEVKTTINGCNEPFIISQNQHRLMSDHQLKEGVRPQVVYIVARVYNLLSANVDVEFYVDPKRLEGNALQFDWGTCAVTPRM